MSANSDRINCASVGACVWDNGPASLQPRVGGPVHAMDLDDRTMGTGSFPVKNPVDFGQTGAIPDQHVQIGMGRSSPSNSDQSEVASS